MWSKMSAASLSADRLRPGGRLLALSLGLSLVAGQADPGRAAGASSLEWRLAGEAGLQATAALPGPGQVLLDAFLDVEASRGPLRWRLMADPAVPWMVEGEGLAPAQVEWALQEASVSWRGGPWQASAGRQRLPLETARLLVPFAVETLSRTGLRLGVWGGQLVWAEGSTRLRMAWVKGEGPGQQPGPVVSLRVQGAGVEVEGHAAAVQPGGQASVGLAASGLVGVLVAYAEVWHGPDGRYVGGLSGLWGESLWTVEAGRAAWPVGSDAVGPAAAASLSWQSGRDVAWTVGLRALAGQEGATASLEAERLRLASDREWRLFASVRLGPGRPAWWAGGGYRRYWGG